jgi:hypothetical protein
MLKTRILKVTTDDPYFFTSWELDEIDKECVHMIWRRQDGRIFCRHCYMELAGKQIDDIKKKASREAEMVGGGYAGQTYTDTEQKVEVVLNPNRAPIQVMPSVPPQYAGTTTNPSPSTWTHSSSTWAGQVYGVGQRPTSPSPWATQAEYDAALEIAAKDLKWKSKTPREQIDEIQNKLRESQLEYHTAIGSYDKALDRYKEQAESYQDEMAKAMRWSQLGGWKKWFRGSDRE